jgi:putative membrane-bound dehydrogenase-like protein
MNHFNYRPFRSTHLLIGFLGLMWLTTTTPIRAQETPALPSLAGDADLLQLVQPTTPKDPDEALATFQTIPGFHLELVAAEPQVASPVAAAFDEDGHLYVAEMRDYPFRPQPGETPLGRIRLLIDSDDDGRMDQSFVFAEDLLWPTGIACWQGGIFVAAAPHIYYLKDTDEDHRADRREIIFSGFATQNEQGSVNNLGWGIDGFIYGASSMNGGNVTDASQNSAQSVKGHDFRFDPRHPILELISGNSQFGIACDDWGHRFLCDQANPNKYVVLEDRYLGRNPHLRVRDTVDDLARGVTPIFRASPHEGWRILRSRRRLASGERSAQSSGASHDVLDGVAGPVIYRGDAYPSELRGNLLVGDAQNNLIHRRILSRKGATFVSQRADENTEFVRSTDNWFRPVNLFHAPDGTLYVCDMGREIIESIHVPLDVWKHLDLRRGRDRGRLYRIAPNGFQPPRRPRLSQASLVQLVSWLNHRSGWWRDTAQRLLIERRGEAEHETAVTNALVGVAIGSELAAARLQALYVLRDWRQLRPEHLLANIAHAEPELRAQAIQLAEPLLHTHQKLVNAVVERAHDESHPVRFQVALSLGEVPISAKTEPHLIRALVQLAVRDGEDKWSRCATLSSTKNCAAAVLAPLMRELTNPSSGHIELCRQLAYVTAHSGDELGATNLLNLAAQERLEASAPQLANALLLGLYDGWLGSKRPFQSRRDSWSAAAQQWLASRLREASSQALHHTATVIERQRALELLRCAEWSACGDILQAALAPNELDAIQMAALDSLRQFSSPEIVDSLLMHWPNYRPVMRESILVLLLSRAEWIGRLIDSLESRRILPQQLSSAQRTVLANLDDLPLRERALALFAPVDPARDAVVARYRPALEAHGDAQRGAAIYLRECMACHQVRDQGFAVGPNLALVRQRTPEQLLVQILDPNREVQPVYVQYTVTDIHGGIATGLIASDTATSITLRRDRNQEQTVDKQVVDQIVSSDKSLMPEGLENNIRPDEMSDLLAFLQSLQYDMGTEPGRDEPSSTQ